MKTQSNDKLEPILLSFRYQVPHKSNKEKDMTSNHTAWRTV